MRSVSPELLGHFGVCLGESDAGSMAATRLWLLGGGFAEIFELADELRLAPLLSEELLRKHLLPPGPAGRRADGTLTPAAAAKECLAAHAARQEAFLRQLRRMVAALNEAGIEPLLMKGARALWTGEPSWRTQRDLDLLVDAGDLGHGEAVLGGIGFAPPPDLAERPAHHHGTPLFHPDLPGWVELHRAAGNHYAEQLLPTAELIVRAERLADARGTVRLLSPVHHTLHALVHHHVGHGGYAHRSLDLKGLCEFAWELARLGEAGRAALATRAAAHPRLAAALDLWVAAAVDLLGVRNVDPLPVEADAVERWRAIRQRMAGPVTIRKYPGYKAPGYAEEYVMAARASRLRRQPGGRRMARRLRMRLRILASLMPRSPLEILQARAAAFTR